jgi:hypothetical protein
MHVRRSTAVSQMVTQQRVAGERVAAREVRETKAAVAKLPKADRALLAKHGLQVRLVPTKSLEDGMLGATSIVRGRDGRWVPTEIRIASHVHGRGVESLGEIVQHEIGHAISVLRDQDRTEDAAHAYARRH